MNTTDQKLFRILRMLQFFIPYYRLLYTCQEGTVKHSLVLQSRPSLASSSFGNSSRSMILEPRDS